MVYLRLLRTPRLAPLLGAMLVARLSIGINAIAIVLFLREERGSFTAAGIVAGALALGTGLGAPLQGRLVDRLGARAMLPVAAGHATGLVALVVLGGSAGVPVAALCAVAFAAGASMPPVSSVLRTRYPVLLADRPELVRVAFAFDSIVTELLFVIGPLVVAVLVATVAAEAALLVSAVTVLVGTATFLALVPGTSRPVREPGDGAGALGALASPGIRALVITMVPFGATFGVLEVVLPAFARAHEAPGMAGVLIAVWSIGSAAGGFLLGVRERRRPLADVHLLLALSIPLVVLPLALAPSLWLMALLVLPAGLPVAPLIATRNELAGQVAPRGAETEGYTWVITAMVGGVALGAAAAGPVVDAEGWRAAALVGAGVAALGAVAAAACRPALTASLRARAAAG